MSAVTKSDNWTPWHSSERLPYGTEWSVSILPEERNEPLNWYDEKRDVRISTTEAEHTFTVEGHKLEEERPVVYISLDSDVPVDFLKDGVREAIVSAVSRMTMPVVRWLPADHKA